MSFLFSRFSDGTEALPSAAALCADTIQFIITLGKCDSFKK